MPALKRPHPLSALPPKADAVVADRHSRFVPKAGIDFMVSTVMKYKNASRDEPPHPPKADHCGLR